MSDENCSMPIMPSAPEGSCCGNYSSKEFIRQKYDDHPELKVLFEGLSWDAKETFRVAKSWTVGDTFYVELVNTLSFADLFYIRYLFHKDLFSVSYINRVITIESEMPGKKFCISLITEKDSIQLKLPKQ